MRRVLILTACIVFGGAAAANAWVDGYIEGIATNLGGTTNRVDIYLINESPYPTGWVMDSIKGTWDLPDNNPPGATFYLGGDEDTWDDYTTNTDQPYDPPVSYVNFDSLIPSPGATWSLTKTDDDDWSSIIAFQGGWYTTDPGSMLSPTPTNNLLASMIVNNGTWVHFSGQVEFRNGGSTSIQTLEFTVPEPGALAMLIGIALVLAAFGRVLPFKTHRSKS